MSFNVGCVNGDVA